jgi:hypothetical protein
MRIQIQISLDILELILFRSVHLTDFLLESTVLSASVQNALLGAEMKKKLRILLMASKTTSSQPSICSMKLNEISDDLERSGFSLALDGEYLNFPILFKLYINSETGQMIIMSISKESGQECISTPIKNLRFHSTEKPPEL